MTTERESRTDRVSAQLAAGAATSAEIVAEAKERAKDLGWKLFPDEKPEDGTVVLASNARVSLPIIFLVQYRIRGEPGQQHGSFYASRAGVYSIVEPVTCWMAAPVPPPHQPKR